MSAHPILLYDGDCGFCSRVVVFVVERDPAAVFRFAPLQSTLGQRLLGEAGLPLDRLDTIVLVEGDRVRTRSDAALSVARRLPGPWRLASLLRVVPRPLRDAAYDLVARNRTRLGGDRCLLPRAVLGRMLDG